MAYAFTTAGTDYFSRAMTAVAPHPLTVACLVNQASVNVGVHGIVCPRTIGNSSKNEVRRSAADVLATSVASGGLNSSSTASAALSTGTWFSLVGVFASATSRVIYVNGAAATVSAISRIPDNLDSYLLAASTNNTGTGAIAAAFNDCTLAEVGIWSAALGQAEITSLVLGFAPRRIRPQSLIAYTPLRRQQIDWKLGPLTIGAGAPSAQNHPRAYA